MPPSLLTGVDLDALRDQDDAVRRVLSELTFPKSERELRDTFAGYSRSGMDTRLPSGKPYTTVDVGAILADALDARWVHKVIGKSWRAIAEHADGLESTLSHTFPLEGGGHHNRILDWADDLENPKRAGGAVPFKDEDRYVLTHTGFEQLTGHKQGERVLWEPEDAPDPADVKPASIGAA